MSYHFRRVQFYAGHVPSVLFPLTYTISDDQHNTKEVQSVIHPVALSIMSIPSNHLINHRPLSWWISNREECVCIRLHNSCSGNIWLLQSLWLHHTVKFPCLFYLQLLTMLFCVQFFIILSCLISVSVNFSTFLVIGKTSPVTYQVLGHLKTCLVLAFGYILLQNPFSWQNVFGIAIAVVGMGLYSFISVKESQQKANESISQLPQVSTVFFYK